MAKENTGGKSGLTRREFIREAALTGVELAAAGALGAAGVAAKHGVTGAAAPERKPVPGDPGIVVPGREKTPTPTPTRKPTKVVPPNPPSPTPEATVTPEALSPIRLSYEDFAGPNDSMGRQPVDRPVVDQELDALGAYLDVPENRQVFPNLPSRLGVYGIHLDVGPHAGQDWFFVEDVGRNRNEGSDNRYWFWYADQMWPVDSLNGEMWGIYRTDSSIGVSINRNGEWAYPSLQQLGIEQIIAGTARHPSEDVTLTPEAAEVTGDGFRWERYSGTDWSDHVGYYWERSALPNPKHPWNFKDGYNVFRIQFGVLESVEDIGNGEQRCVLNAGEKGKMTVTFYNGQEFTRVYNWMYNTQTDPHVPPGVLSDPENSQRALCYPWPVRADKGPMDKEGDGIPVRKLNMQSQIGRAIGFGVKEDQRSAHDQGAWLSDLACTLGGDWNSQQLQ